MPSECLLIDPNDPGLRSKVESLPKTPGICIFIDIRGSTGLKCADLKEWVAKIHNCFANAGAFLSPFTPVKSMGDALMYYIEDTDLSESGYSVLQIYDGLWQMATDTGPEFPEVRIGAASCKEVLPISFSPGQRDYYGIDIDLTSKLQSMARAREVVVDDRFYRRVETDYHRAGNADEFDESFKHIVGPVREQIPGIPHAVLIYRSGSGETDSG